MVMRRTDHPGIGQCAEKPSLRKRNQDDRHLAFVVVDEDSLVFGGKEMWIRIVGEQPQYMEKAVEMRPREE